MSEKRPVVPADAGVASMFVTEEGEGAVVVKGGMVAAVLLPSTPGAVAEALQDQGVPVSETPLGFRAARLLEAYWRGEEVVFDLPLLLPEQGSFRRRVLDEVQRIPHGQVCTYGTIAARAGSPGGARAVGAIMASNRLPVIVPCHRVVGSTGAMVGYSAPGGLVLKERLLTREGVRLDKGGRAKTGV